MDDLVLVTRGRPPETGSWMDEVGLGGISARGLDSIEGFKGLLLFYVYYYSIQAYHLYYYYYYSTHHSQLTTLTGY